MIYLTNAFENISINIHIFEDGFAQFGSSLMETLYKTIINRTDVYLGVDVTGFMCVPRPKIRFLAY